MQLFRVLNQAMITHLHMAELTHDQAERVLNLGADSLPARAFHQGKQWQHDLQLSYRLAALSRIRKVFSTSQRTDNNLRRGEFAILRDRNRDLAAVEYDSVNTY